MRALRTPDEYFESLPGYPYAPKYEVVDADGELRMHFVAEGPKDGRQVLLLHPAPAWTYLYRSVIPILAEAGCRVIAPDAIGFGRSDKPVEPDDHDFARQLQWTASFVHAQVKAGAILVSDGWLGLHLLAADPARFDAALVIDAGEPEADENGDYYYDDEVDAEYEEEGDSDYDDEPVEPTAGDRIQIGVQRSLSAKVLAAYDAPFPDEDYEAALHAELEPGDDENQRALAALEAFEAPLVAVLANQGAGELGELLRERVPGAGRDSVILHGAGRFAPEDRGPELAAEILALAARL